MMIGGRGRFLNELSRRAARHTAPPSNTNRVDGSGTVDDELVPLGLSVLVSVSVAVQSRVKALKTVEDPNVFFVLGSNSIGTSPRFRPTFLRAHRRQLYEDS
jgi:hypothetical protein